MATKKIITDAEVIEVSVAGESTEMDALETATEAAGSEGAVVEEAKIYIGASFKGVATGTVFQEGNLTPAMATAIAIMPAIAELLVPISRLVNARTQLQDEKSARSYCYEQSKKYAERK